MYLLAGIRRFSAKAPLRSGPSQSSERISSRQRKSPSARLSIVYTVEQITALAESLPSEDVLKWCKDNGYAVMPAPPTAMPLLDVRESKSSHFYWKTEGWYADQKFAREDKTSFGWLAIKKTPVSNSTNKKWDEQSKLLSALLEHIPNAAEMSWFITTYFEVRGIRLFESAYVRTSSLDSSGFSVDVGHFDSMGPLVNYYWDDNRNDNLWGPGQQEEVNPEP